MTDLLRFLRHNYDKGLTELLDTATISIEYATTAEFFSYFGVNELKEYLILLYGVEEYEKAIKSQRARKARSKRVRDRVAHIVLNGKSYFLTLTFRDELFSKTNFDTRRQYARRFLSSFCDDYVANIDFGKENHREHYHAIISADSSPKLIDWYEKCGAFNLEPIRARTKDLFKVSKYITKLSCHSIKETTGKAYRIIYSRPNKKVLLECQESVE